MNYFVNENIFTMNSGTEFSAIKRLKLFKKNAQAAMLLTRNYNPQSMSDLSRVGLDAKDVINLYDFFQETTAVSPKDENVRFITTIDKTKYHIEGIDANTSLIKHAGKTIAKVTIAPATVGLVGSIDYYNDMNALIAKDIWDRRGFKSSTQYMHPDGSLGPQVFFDQKGQPKIEVTHMNINGVLSSTMWKLLDYRGKVWRFNSENELFGFFLEELAQKEKAVFINDRPSLIPAVAAIKSAYGKWQYLHNVHTTDPQSAGASRHIEEYLIPFFTTYARVFDGVIVPTQAQKEEIKKYFHFKQVLSLPDTYADAVVLNTQPRAPRLIFLGRISAEKNPIDSLEILSRIHQTNPDVTLDIYGYASPIEIQKQMEEKVEQLGLKESVHFRGYQTDEVISNALDEAAVLLSVSKSEAFGINILQAMSHGVPVVAYKVKYGAQELIEDQKNGRLVAYGSLSGAAQAVIDLLDGHLIQAAYEKAQKFSEANAWSLWEQAKNENNHL